MHVIEGCTLKSGTYEEELRVILTVVEAAEDAFVLIDDADLVVALGAITSLESASKIVGRTDEGVRVAASLFFLVNLSKSAIALTKIGLYLTMAHAACAIWASIQR